MCFIMHHFHMWVHAVACVVMRSILIATPRKLFGLLPTHVGHAHRTTNGLWDGVLCSEAASSCAFLTTEHSLPIPLHHCSCHRPLSRFSMSHISSSMSWASSVVSLWVSTFTADSLSTASQRSLVSGRHKDVCSHSQLPNIYPQNLRHTHTRACCIVFSMQRQTQSRCRSPARKLCRLPHTRPLVRMHADTLSSAMI